MYTPQKPSTRQKAWDSFGTADSYSIFFEEASDPMFIADQRQRFLAVNREWLAMTGYSLEDLVSIADVTLNDPPDIRQPAAPLTSISQQDRTTICEQGFLHKDGWLLHLEISHRTLADGNILCVARDITVRKRAEEVLRKTTTLLEQTFEQSPIPMVLVSMPDAVFRFVNPACLDFLGMQDEPSVIGTSLLNFNPSFQDYNPDGKLGIIADLPLARALRGEKTVNEQRCIVRKDGTTRWELVNAAPIFNSQAQLIAGYLTMVDDTERKKAETAQQDSEKKLRAIFERSPVGIILLDSQSTVLDCNEHFAAIFDVERERYLGIKLLDHLPVGPIRDNLLKTLTGEGIHRFEDSHVSIFSGKQIYLSIVSEKITPDLLIVVMSDITEQKQAALAQEKLQDQLLQAQKMESVGRLAGGVAHDFNNMLTAILGHTELALANCSPQDAIRDDLKVIETAAHRSADLVRQLLAFARKQTVTPKILDLNDCIAGLLKMMARLIGEDIDLVWKPNAEVWPISIDPSQIDQILANLCINARDAIPGVGKITIGTKNSVIDGEYCSLNPTINPGDYVQLRVSDNGLGMNKDILEHIFEPFFTTKEVGKGTGLGLSTVYGIAKQNRGFVNVYSEPGTGTTFKIYLPRFAATAVEPEVKKKTAIPKGYGQLILLVEDEEVILNVGQVMLNRLGYTVLPAASPSEALHQAQAHAGEIKLLITDVIMPEMNGHDLAQLLVEQIPGLRCLFTSGYTADIITHHGVLDEKINFIQKPFSFMELAVKVREVMDQNPY
ncbi:MAG: PAS domain S-box protein [Pseudomonadota bacterium]